MADRIPGPLDQAPGELDALGMYASRQITKGTMAGHWLTLEPMTFARVRLCITPEGPTLDAALTRGGYLDVWEFETMFAARHAFETWNGEWTIDRASEPVGWSRHPLTARRRKPFGAYVRAPELPLNLIAELRADVAGGAGHECQEWRAELTDGADSERCLLCDRALDPVSIDTRARVDLREATDAEQLDALQAAVARRRLELEKGGNGHA